MKASEIEKAISEEIEANRFAMELLMPSPWVKERFMKLMVTGMHVEDAVEKMAQEFKVHVYYMSIKIHELKLVRKYVTAIMERNNTEGETG